MIIIKIDTMGIIFTRDAKSDRYGRYISVLFHPQDSAHFLDHAPTGTGTMSTALLHCAIRTVPLILWSQHRADNRVLLTPYQYINITLPTESGYYVVTK